MVEWTFDAIGTKWVVTLDAEAVPESLQQAVDTWLTDFNQQFSRFVEGSEVNRFVDTSGGTYEISATLAELLTVADELRSLTDGRFDPAIGRLMEQAGYDREYSLIPREEVNQFVLPKWTLAGTILTTDGPVKFDLGGIGKGYAIDQVAGIIAQFGHEHFLVDAGGDMFGTTKADGSPWRVAIEYPGRPDFAAGVLEVSHQALAVSDVFRRRWGSWHHLIDPHEKESVSHLKGAAATAPAVMAADAMTSALFFAQEKQYAQAAKIFAAQYLVFKEDGSVTYSSDWKGEVF